MSNIWVTSDLHLGHANIIRFCNRPFSNVEEMDECLIDNWNSLVKKEDTIYCLGDFAFKVHPTTAKKQFDRLNGKKHLILGNHDHMKVVRYCGWQSVNHYLELKVTEKKIVLFHYPIESWNGRYYGSMMLHGHVHSLPGNPKCLDVPNRYDVGVDLNNFAPVNLESLIIKSQQEESII